MPAPDELPATTAAAEALEAEGWQCWLETLFPSFVGAGFADRHGVLWDWAWQIVRGQRPRPMVAVWPRGGGKSTSAELVTVAIGARQVRSYVLYICETQDQADQHVASIAAMLESRLIEQHYPALAARKVGKYGNAKGWRREQLRTASGFNVEGIGLDVARRGAKLDEYRPDLIIIDDIDGKHDTPNTTQRKIDTLTKSLLPAGATDCAVLGVQNLIHADSIFSRMVDDRADFLSDRIVSGPYQAVEGLEVEEIDGQLTITAGTATWAGQNLVVCQGQIRQWGYAAFVSESQQEVGGEGRYFKEWNEARHTCAPFPIPDDWPVWLAIDWGWTHPTAIYVFTLNGDDHLFVIGEHVEAHWLPEQHVMAIRGLIDRLSIAPSRIRNVVAGSDAFAQRGDSQQKTIADQFQQVYDESGANIGFTLTKANTDRVGGALEVSRRLGNLKAAIHPTVTIWKTCPRLIACLPRLIHDPARPEDVLKVDADAHGRGGDDEYDGFRYGTMAAYRKPKTTSGRGKVTTVQQLFGA